MPAENPTARPVFNLVRDRAGLWIAMLFFLAFLPILASLSRWRGDERLYTDAGVRMVRTGDYLTPYTDAGEPRFHKPILTYWMVVAGFRIFGTEYLGARFLFLAAGALTVALTARLARTLGLRPGDAALAAAMLAANYTVFHTAVRSTPDIPLCLFTALSLSGFANLIWKAAPARWDGVAAWGGAGLAVATKGALGLVIPLFALGFVGMTGRRPCRPLASPGAVLLGAATGLSWYVFTVVVHGQEAWNTFLTDQIGQRVGGKTEAVIRSVLVYPLSGILQFLPLSIPALIGAVWLHRRRELQTELAPGAAAFILSWYALIFLLFVGANIHRPRYMLPTYPLIAVLYAGLCGAAIDRLPGFNPFLRRAGRGIAWGGLAASALVTLFGLRVVPRVAVGGLLFVGLSLALLAAARRGTGRTVLLTGAMATLLAFAWGDLFLRSAFVTSAARPVAAALAAAGARGAIPFAEVLSRQLGQVTVVSRGDVTPKAVAVEDIGRLQSPWLVVGAAGADAAVRAGYELTPCAFASTRWSIGALWSLWRSGGAEAAWDSHRTPIFIGRRPLR